MKWPKFALLIITLTQIKYSQQRCRKMYKRPNIIVIMSDDMGHNDLSISGSNQIPTPNIDALGYNGVVLDRYYVQNSCTPSRAAFLTGYYPFKIGMQGLPIVAGQNRSLPFDVPIMPQFLKKLGYKTHLVGKWHLGSAYRSSTPTRRGFDSHFGYWNGFLGYFDYLTDFNDTKIEGFDLHDDFDAANEERGKYATTVFTEKAVKLIENHDSTKPMFLLVTHLAAHAGLDSVELGVPNRKKTDQKYSYISDIRRRLYADIVGQLDDSVGQIVETLSKKQMLENSIILFYSDNGAPTVGRYQNSGSNWPLRSIKLTDFEGAVRVTGVVYSSLFKKKGYVNRHLFHVSDWLPTFYAAAGGDVKDLGPIDGINQWDTISKDAKTNRTEILLNLDEVQNMTSIITDNGNYKLVTGVCAHGIFEEYYGDSGRSSAIPPYNMQSVIKSKVNKAILPITELPISLPQIKKTRLELDLSWCRNANLSYPLTCQKGCLFNLGNDPCETTNIIRENGNIADRLLSRINEFWEFLVPQGNMTVDPNANPERYNNVWCTWLDDSWCDKTANTVKKK